MKIELLYTNPLLDGDVHGGTNYGGYVSYTWQSIYMKPNDYPDTRVNLIDVYFVAMQFGTSEGQTSPPVWDYMADIVPDRVVNLKDVYQVALGFGGSGTYTWPYVYNGLAIPPTWNIPPSTVSVTFNNLGGSYDPYTLNGFVPVPSVSTSFTITYSSLPIGAVVTFWP